MTRTMHAPCVAVALVALATSATARADPPGAAPPGAAPPGAAPPAATPPGAAPPAATSDLAQNQYRLQLGQQYQRESYAILAAGGFGLAVGGFLIHRGATACARWAQDDNDDDYLCTFAELSYLTLGTTVGIVGVTGVVAGIIRWRLGSNMEDEARRGMSVAFTPTPGGGEATLTLRF